MSRDNRLSNVKGLLIFCVVLGHLIAPYHYFNILYLFIYSFHMPLFILLTGYFAKHVTWKKVINFIIILVIFQLLYRSFLVLINPGKVFNPRWEVPYYHLWYLLGIIFWYLLAIALRRLPAKGYYKVVIVILCFFIGIAAKYFAGPFEAFMRNYDHKFISDTFSYLRTLTFLPFFFLGFYLSEENMQKIYHSLKGNKLVPILTAAGVIAYLTFSNIDNEEKIFKGNYGVWELKGSLMFKTSHILLAYLIALIMCFIIVNVISGKESFLTKWGDRTLPIYLFHAFFVMLSKKIVILQSLNPWILLIIMLLSVFVIITILSSDIFIKCTYYLWNPYRLIDKLIHRNKKNPSKT